MYGAIHHAYLLPFVFGFIEVVAVRNALLIVAMVALYLDWIA
jgi:hypothetical protein